MRRFLRSIYTPYITVMLFLEIWVAVSILFLLMTGYLGTYGGKPL